MTNNELFALALDKDLEAEIAECEALPDHTFSREFENKMNKLLQNGFANEHHTTTTRDRKKSPIAVIMAISTFLLTGAAVTSYNLWKNFSLQDRGLYTLLHITDVENCPRTLEDPYRLTADLNGFTENILSDDEYMFFAEYENKEKDIKISFQQETKHGVSKMLNTEDKDSPIEVTVNGCNGIYFESKYDHPVLIWDTGDYIITLSASGISKDDLFSLAEFVQKVE